jgi:hypothetical protein
MRSHLADEPITLDWRLIMLVALLAALTAAGWVGLTSWFVVRSTPDHNDVPSMRAALESSAVVPR